MKYLEWELGKEVTFYACMWDDGWEFDAPFAIYSPIKICTDYGGNDYAIDSMVENICIGICCEEKQYSLDWDKGSLKEMEWRGWGKGFSRRKKAQHVKIKIKFVMNKEGEKDFEYIGEREEQWGPFTKG
jgi:hypothetical protein